MTAFIKMSIPVLDPLPNWVVCPYCKRKVTSYLFKTEEFVNSTYVCIEHGDVPVPMRSAVVNRYK